MRISAESIQRLDLAGMFRCIADFPAQVEEAVEIGQEASLHALKGPFSSIVLSGMGGSAIGGDLLRSYALQELAVPFIVSRGYDLPASASSSSLVIVASYSGNTEETLSAYQVARKRRANILCLTTGGEVERQAKRNRHVLLKVVPGLQPRAALGYSFFPLLIAFGKLGLIRKPDRDIQETIDLLWRMSKRLSDYRSKKNEAVGLARALHGKLPIVYSSAGQFESVNVRWRGQISENAKQLAYGHVLPEMNHNEIVGWDVDRALLKKTAVVFLRDKSVHPRVQYREDITRSIVNRFTGEIHEVWSEGSSLLARTFSLVYLGDWVSYYLAILNRRDPTPVKVIDSLKRELAKS